MLSGRDNISGNVLHFAPLRLIGISGSLRQRSYDSAALRAAGSIMPKEMELQIAEIIDLPMYNQDDEQSQGFNEPVLRLRKQVAEADAVLIATPEYNYGMTGALKNAIDWLSRPPNPPSTSCLRPFSVREDVWARLAPSAISATSLCTAT